MAQGGLNGGNLRAGGRDPAVLDTPIYRGVPRKKGKKKGPPQGHGLYPAPTNPGPGSHQRPAQGQPEEPRAPVVGREPLDAASQGPTTVQSYGILGQAEDLLFQARMASGLTPYAGRSSQGENSSQQPWCC